MTTPTPPPEEPPAEFRPRIRRDLVPRIADYAARHYADDRGVRRSLSLNSATEQLLEAALSADETGVAVNCAACGRPWNEHDRGCPPPL